MTTKQQEKQQALQEHKERQHLDARIGKHVIHSLGQPNEFHRVQIRPLWEGHYRVNVFVGEDAASARIAHSYFVVTDGGGNILEAAPKIVRQY